MRNILTSFVRRAFGKTLLIATIGGAVSASAALVTLTNSDALNTSSFSSGTGATNWDSGQPPAAGNSYVCNGKGLRSPLNGLAAAKYTFAGDSLLFQGSMQFLIKCSNVVTVPNLIVSNNTQAVINGASGATPDVATLAGNVLVLSNGYFNASATNRSLVMTNVTFSGSGALQLVGQGALYLGNASTSFTGPVTITGQYVEMNGSTVITPSGLIVGRDATLITVLTNTSTTNIMALGATNLVRAGGKLNVGTGSAGDLRVAYRTSANESNTVVALLDVSAQNQFNANVGNFVVGFNNAGATIATCYGTALLATNNVIVATNIVIGDSGSTASTQPSQVILGRGTNVLDSPILVVGGRKQRGILSLPAGGTLWLTNSVSSRMDLTVGANNFNTGVTPNPDTLDLTGGPVTASLGTLIIAQKTGQGSGGVTATLTTATNANNIINANEVVVGTMTGNTSGSTAAAGAINLNGGSYVVNNNVTLAAYDNSGAGAATGTLNLNAGTLTVSGDIANAGGLSTITVNAGILSVNGNIANTNLTGTNTLNCNGGTIKVAGDINSGTGAIALNVNSGLLDLMPAGDAVPGNVTVSTLLLNGAMTNAGTVQISADLSGSGSSRNQSGTLTVSGSLNPGKAGAAGTLTLGSLALTAGTTLRMDLTNATTVGSGVNDFLDITGDLDLGGATLQVGELATGLATGTYRLANVTGNILNSFGTYPATIGRFNLSVQVDGSTSPKHLNLVVNGAPYSLSWGGELSSAWDITGTQNWTNQLNAPDYYYDNDNVRFDDASANPNVTLDVTVQPGNVVFSNNANSYNLSTPLGTGIISGGATLTKDGTGWLTLATSNDFSGAVSINAGRVQTTAVGGNNGVNGAAGALGGAGGVVTIASGATLDVNDQHFTNKVIHVQGIGDDGNGPIINTDTLDSNGDRQATRNVVLDGDTTFGGSRRWDIRGTAATNTGSLTGNHVLTVNNTGGCFFTDGINVNIGDILINASGSRLALETYTTINTNAIITVNGGAWLYFYRLISPMGRPVIMQDGASMGSTDATSTNQNQVSGPVTINGTATFSASGNATNFLHLAGPVSGPGLFVKSGANTVELDNTSNSWTGGTLISQGILQVGNGTLDGNLSDVPTTNNATLVYASSTAGTLTAPVDGPGTWALTGSGLLTLNGQITGASTFNIRSNGNLTINGHIDTTAGVSKVGDGIVTLTASNSFPGNYTTGSGTPTSGGITRVLNSFAFGDPSLSKTVSVIRAEVRLESTNAGVTLGTNAYFLTSANSGVTGVGGGYVALRNVSGTNIVDSTLELGGGAGDSEYSSDAGLLTLNGMILLGNTSARSAIFSGAGNGVVSGVITNTLEQSGANALSVSKTGTGKWTLTAVNAYNGSTTVKGGTLLINGSIGGSSLTVQSNATLGGVGAITTTNNSFLAGSHAVFTLGSPLAFAAPLTLATSGAVPDVHLNLSNNVPVGTYPLATYGPTGSSGSFAATPVVDSGSFAAGTQGTISTSGGSVLLTVAVSAPAVPPSFPPGAVSVLPDRNISLVATGAVGAQYRLWATTNLALSPVTNAWTPIATNTVGASGSVTNVDLKATNYPQRFYLFSSP